MMRNLLYRILLLLLLAGCETLQQAAPELTLVGNGEPVFVYLQPLPGAAERLRISIGSLAAERSDGTMVPLVIALERVGAQEPRGQRLLATGLLPEGEYRGLAVMVRSASLRTPDGEAALLVPEAPVSTSGPFRVVPGEALVLALALDYAASMRTGFSIVPDLSLFVPERPVAAVTGLVAGLDPSAVLFFDKQKRQVAAAVALARGGRSVSIDQRGRRAFAAEQAADSVAAIDLVEGRVIKRMHLQTGDEPSDLAFAADSGTLLVANSGSSTISLLDVPSGHEVARLAVGEAPRSILLGPDDRRAYVFNTDGDSLSVIDVPNRAMISTIAIDPKPLEGALNRAGDRLYVICASSPYMTVLDVASLAVLRREFIGTGAARILVDRRTDLIYLARRGEHALSVYDPISFLETERIETGGPVEAMAIDGDENVLFLVMPSIGRVAGVNLMSRQLIGGFDVGRAPKGLALMGER